LHHAERRDVQPNRSSPRRAERAAGDKDGMVDRPTTIEAEDIRQSRVFSQERA
jgi:hypothetical protein